jgi:hypothetical protein
MQKFSIFIRSDKFYWSINKVIYSILFLCCGIMLFKEKILNLDKNNFDVIFIWLTLIVLFCGLVTKFIGFTKTEPIRGKLDGYLFFDNKSITVKNTVYLIDEIIKIQISNEDYNGKLVNFTSGNLGPALSNGTNNHIIIFLKIGETKKYEFELINSDDFQNLRTELINYYLNKKIDFDNLANVLGEKSRKEIKEFKSEIEKIRTTVNINMEKL